jgi:hypothetical protein
MAAAELVLRGSTVERRDTSTGPACDVTLVIEALKPDTDPAPDGATAGCGSACSAHPADRCGPATTPDGFQVPDEVAAVLRCDPIITALVIDLLGVPLDLGRKLRLVNRDQRRALARRDGGCIFPGCGAPVGWCDAHHVIWWDHGGPTDIWNLALLCRYHHGVVHRHGWTMTATADQRFTITTPLGQTLHSQRHRGRSPTSHPRHLQPA